MYGEETVAFVTTREPSIVRVDFQHGTAARLPIPASTIPRAISYNQKTGRLVWTDVAANGGAVMSANIDGYDVQRVDRLATGTNFALTLASFQLRTPQYIFEKPRIKTNVILTYSYNCVSFLYLVHFLSILKPKQRDFCYILLYNFNVYFNVLNKCLPDLACLWQASVSTPSSDKGHTLPG